MLEKTLILKIEQAFQNKDKAISIKQVSALSGGCINECYKVETENTNYFLKINVVANHLNMFSIEAKSLSILNETNSIKTPGIIAQFNFDNQQFLLLEWIESDKTDIHFWKGFAENLAKLHQHSANQFGLEFDNYIGSLKQSNTYTENWLKFYIQQRIQPQVKLAFNQNKINKNDIHQFEQFYKGLSNFFPKEPPALIHGDLWNGNFLCNHNKQVVLIDPAIYYANREMEIAFTKLFGGFHPVFYQTYQEIYPFEDGFEQRIPVYNLYSLLVHLNLFGGHYYKQVLNIVCRF